VGGGHGGACHLYIKASQPQIQDRDPRSHHLCITTATYQKTKNLKNTTIMIIIITIIITIIIKMVMLLMTITLPSS